MNLPLLLPALAIVAQAAAQTPHTPRPGSGERQAICDAAREHVVSKYATRALPQPIVFKIDRISATATYANLQAIPLFKDGSYVGTEYMPDVAFNFCLQKAGGAWQVIVDLSRTDVPDSAEAASIRRKLPPDFPLALLSPSWRDLLRAR